MSKIEWTEKTWNPIIGCSPCSTGCLHCYAERMARRQTAMRPGCEYGQVIGDDGKWNGKTAFVESAIDKPLKRNKPTLWFVVSMGDVFHESVPLEWIRRVYTNMSWCFQHRFLILTKRPATMMKYMQNIDILPNVGIGTTVCNQKEADAKIPVLLQIPAAFRFVSFEPALGAVDFTRLQRGSVIEIDALHGTHGVIRPHMGENAKLDWIIIGGESGPDARPMNPEWVRSVVRQCRMAGVPIFFKQWGEYVPVAKDFSDMDDLWIGQDGETYPSFNVVCDNPRIGYVLVGKKRASHLLDGQEVREWPKWLEGYHG